MGGIRSMIKCHFLGEMVRDPMLKCLNKANGDTVDCVNFSLMISRKFRKKGGEQGVQKCYLDFEAWDEGARIISDSFSKGDYISVYASAKTDTYVDKNNSKVTKVKFRVNDFDFVNFKQDSSVV